MEVNEQEDIRIILESQYRFAYELLADAVAAGLTPIVIGPPGVGKSLLVRKFARDTLRPFYELFFDELLRPSYLIGSFDPAIVLQKGYIRSAFDPGPLIRAMQEGGIFLAQEINRASEFCQNSLLEPMEERSYYIPRVGRIYADEKFTVIATANPAELAGTHRLSEALRDRLRVWIPLTYPDRDTELQIIKLNCAPASLDGDTLAKIYAIVNAMRENQELEMAISVRAGISIAKLAAQHISQQGELTDQTLSNYACNVLLGALEKKGWMTGEQVIKEQVKRLLTNHA